MTSSRLAGLHSLGINRVKMTSFQVTAVVDSVLLAVKFLASLSTELVLVAQTNVALFLNMVVCAVNMHPAYPAFGQMVHPLPLNDCRLFQPPMQRPPEP